MNTFYYFEGRIFETREKAEAEKKRTGYHTSIDEIKTNKSFDEFDDAFDELKAEGNSDLDSIEGAR